MFQFDGNVVNTIPPLTRTFVCYILLCECVFVYRPSLVLLWTARDPASLRCFSIYLSYSKYKKDEEEIRSHRSTHKSYTQTRMHAQHTHTHTHREKDTHQDIDSLTSCCPSVRTQNFASAYAAAAGHCM